MARARLPTHYVQSDGTLITDSLGDIGSTWVKNETAPATVEQSNDITYNGGQTIRFRSVDTAGGNSFVTKAVNIDLTGITHVTIAMWVGEIIPGTGSSLTVYLIESTPGTSLLKQAVFTAQKPGWNLITRPISVFSGSGAWNPIRQIRVRVDTSAAVARDIAFGGLWMNKRNRPKVCISFDDGWVDAVTVDSICSAAQVPVSYGIIPKLIDNLGGSYLTTAQLTALAASPYAEIVCHDVDRWADDVFDVGGAAALLARIKGIRQYIERFDREGSNYAVYPEGDYGLTNQLWKRFLPVFRQTGILGCRMVVPTTVEVPVMMDSRIGIGDPLLVPAIASLNNTQTLSAVKGMVDAAIQYGGNAFLYGHRLGGAADSLTWVTSDFQSLIDYIVAKRNQGSIDVMRLSDWFKTATYGRKRRDAP